MKNSKSNYEDGDNAEIEIDDRNFIDMVTSKIILLFFHPRPVFQFQGILSKIF